MGPTVTVGQRSLLSVGPGWSTGRFTGCCRTYSGRLWHIPRLYSVRETREGHNG